ncbi:MAG TPA: hypothetical protein VFY83_10370, partial [Anaerolineales bacterium]|nr:hypothetical protein [Anaerolineales bacterium]
IYGNRALTGRGPDIYASTTNVDDALKILQRMGAKIARLYPVSVGYPRSIWPSVGGPANETAFRLLDYAIQQCGIYGIRVYIPLINSNDRFSGYTGSFSNWGGSNFFTDTTAINNFKTFVSAILNRTNYYTGVVYKNDPTILGWEPCNEQTSGQKAWTSNLAAYIKGIDSNHLVFDGYSLSGSFGGTNNDPTDANVDVFTRHSYGMDTTQIANDLAVTGMDSKVYAITEYDPRSNPTYFTGTYLPYIEGNDRVVFDLFWSILAHDDGYGYPISYNSRAPSFYDFSTGNGTDLTYLQSLRAHAYVMTNRSAPSTHPEADAPEITFAYNGKITWRGSAWANTYNLERSTNNIDWTEIATGLTDLSSPYTDAGWSGTPYYRLRAMDAGGTGGPYSASKQMLPGWWIVGSLTAANFAAVYQPKGAPSKKAQILNLNNMGVNDVIMPSSYVAWSTTNGWEFNGSSMWVKCGLIVPSAGYSFFVWFTNYVNTAAVHSLFGYGDGSPNRWNYSLNNGSGNRAYNSGTGSVAPGAFVTSGVIGIAGSQGWKNGVKDGGALAALQNANGRVPFVGALNSSGSPNFYSQVNVQAVAILNMTPSDSDVAALMAATF